MLLFNQLNAAKPAAIPSAQWDPSHCCPKATVLMLSFNVRSCWCSFQTGEFNTCTREWCQEHKWGIAPHTWITLSVLLYPNNVGCLDLTVISWWIGLFWLRGKYYAMLSTFENRFWKTCCVFINRSNSSLDFISWLVSHVTFKKL